MTVVSENEQTFKDWQTWYKSYCIWHASRASFKNRQAGFDQQYHRLLRDTPGDKLRIYSLLQRLCSSSVNDDFSLATSRFQIVTCGPGIIPDWSVKSCWHPFLSSCPFLHLSCDLILQFILPSKRTSIKTPTETKHTASQTKERSQAEPQLSLATYLHRPWDDYSSAVQDFANFSRKPYLCTPASRYPTIHPFFLIYPTSANSQITKKSSSSATLYSPPLPWDG